MTREQINSKLREVMTKSSQASVDWEAVTEESPIESLGIDSLAMLDLMYDLQQEFKIEFEAEELINVKVVGDLTSFIEQRLSA